jgi:hypothetical protein
MGAKRSNKRADLNDAEPTSYSVYSGRARLGQFVCLKKKIEAFDSTERHLGTFFTREEALSAIRAASESPS